MPGTGIMTSSTKAKSNRRNAKKSTGPRTRTGKAKAALNAIKHGLSAQLIYDPETSARISAVASEFLEGLPQTELTTLLARQAAEAQIMFERVQEAKRQVWHEVASHPHIVKRGQFHDLNDANELNQLEDKLREGFLGLMPLAPHLFAEPFYDEAEHDAEIIRLATKKRLNFIRFERRTVNQRDKSLISLFEAASK